MKTKILTYSALIAIGVIAVSKMNAADSVVKPLNAEALILKANIDASLAQYQSVLFALNQATTDARASHDKKAVEKASEDLSQLIDQKKTLEETIRRSTKEYNLLITKDNKTEQGAAANP
jgi:hypothetical protein